MFSWLVNPSLSSITTLRKCCQGLNKSTIESNLVSFLLIAPQDCLLGRFWFENDEDSLVVFRPEYYLVLLLFSIFYLCIALYILDSLGFQIKLLEYNFFELFLCNFYLSTFYKRSMVLGLFTYHFIASYNNSIFYEKSICYFKTHCIFVNSYHCNLVS